MNLNENILRVKELMRVILEQPDSRMPFQPETFGYKQGKPETINPAIKNQKKNLEEIPIDDAIDLISAAIDGVPGVGNLISLGIDEIHAISYFVRAGMKSEPEKTKYIILGVLTALLGLVGIGGNIALLTTKQGIKKILNQTPQSIQKWAIDNGIINYRILLGKGKFKYSILLLICRILADESVEMISGKIQELNQTFKISKSVLIKKKLLTPEMESILNFVIYQLAGTPQEISIAKQMVDKGFI